MITLSLFKFSFFFFRATNSLIFRFTSLILFIKLNSFISSLSFNSFSFFSKFNIIAFKLFSIFSCFSKFSFIFVSSSFFRSLLLFITKAFSNNEFIFFKFVFNIIDSIFNSFILVTYTDLFNFSNLSFSNFISLFVCFISFFILKNKFPVDEFLLLDKALIYIESLKIFELSSVLLLLILLLFDMKLLFVEFSFILFISFVSIFAVPNNNELFFIIMSFICFSFTVICLSFSSFSFFNTNNSFVKYFTNFFICLVS